MGRKKLNLSERKIKIGITLDRDLYQRIKNSNLIPSQLLNKLLRTYYDNQGMQ